MPTSRHLTFANVASALALTFSLGLGGAFAATQLPKNSVTTKQVKDRTLLAEDFKAGQLPRGPRGAAGATGPAGADGVDGADAVTYFAAVEDMTGGPDVDAVLGFNRGATSVLENAGTSLYQVFFDADLTRCVGTVSPGTGTPATSGINSSVAASSINVFGNSALVAFRGTNDVAVDTSFMVTITCGGVDPT